MQTLAQTPFVPSDHEHTHTDCAIQCKEQGTRKDSERRRTTEGKLQTRQLSEGMESKSETAGQF